MNSCRKKKAIPKILLIFSLVLNTITQPVTYPCLSMYGGSLIKAIGCGSLLIYPNTLLRKSVSRTWNGENKT